MDWNKDHIRETMLSLETAALHSARDNYLDYVSAAKLDRSEPIENDEQAQAEVASELAEALDDTLHDYADKIEKLKMIDFSAQSVNRPLKVGACGDHFEDGVSQAEQVCSCSREFDARLRRDGSETAISSCV